MKKTLITAIVLAIGLLPVVVNAAIISVAGPASSAGTAPAIIAAPANALNSAAFNSGMEGFDEAQGVVTTAAHNIDSGGPIPAGTWVSSHMIFLNKKDDIPGGLTHNQVVWTFDGPVVGVMSDYEGDLEVASTFELGAPGTNYTVGAAGQVAPYPARGMEGDSYLVVGNTITVNMHVTQPGDWIRVVTLAPIVEVDIDIKPGSFPNSINPDSKGVIPVAILGTDDFDAILVDPETVLFGPDAASPLRWALEDVDGDGDIDLILHFKTQGTGLKAGDTDATLTGETIDGIPIQGTDTVNIVPKGGKK